MASPQDIPPPEYFTALARGYARQTGRAKESIFASCFEEIKPSITASSVIHDNAGGVGTATAVILSRLGGDAVPEVLITDNNAGMIAAAKEGFKAHSSRITAAEMDSQDLGSLPDGKFTHSIMNFSIFLLPDAVGAVREIRRTLRPDGVTLISVYKRFGFGRVVHAAQTAVRPDLPLVPLPGAQFYDDQSVLAKLVVEAGFDEDKVRVLERETVRRGEDLEGMKAFMQSDFAAMATKSWPDEDKAKWPAAVEEAFGKEVEEHGGMKFVSWTAIARK